MSNEDNPVSTREIYAVPIGVGKLTGLSTAKGLAQVVNLSGSALGVPNGSRYALIAVEGAGVRYADDGQTPTASEGHPVSIGATMKYDGDLSKIRFIEQTTSATLRVSFYR